MVQVPDVERVADAGQWAVLALTGEVDLSLVTRVREAVDELVADGRVWVVWDLKRVNFMDSSGVGVLVYTMRSVEEHNGSVRLAGLSGQVRRLLTLTGMDTEIDCYPDLASASDQNLQ
ncbi:putative anti-sigma factor antagonist [Streptomyces sp. Tu6071]|uniref:STAS domain-containing protein n=1 Tax=Streptomyces sp. Tu6071 TaxID=355249 RepID=UPI00020E5291|nr:STAS domain-containing protein [Streptomyces sp. Tu6071]EGJ73760.1 putative anti-sigma factor antagonist [Streptomyces sp. Tu6071]